MISGGKFGPKKINPGTGRLIVHRGKGEKLLPSPSALKTLTKGNPQERSFQNYAKLTPSGRNAPVSYQDITDMARMGASIDKK
jgi:hypothetical protein